jgi:hypothetical protein
LSSVSTYTVEGLVRAIKKRFVRYLRVSSVQSGTELMFTAMFIF